jgi:hypothetical protein
VVAHKLQVVQQVRLNDDDREPALGHGLAQYGEELPPSQGVERGYGLVEEEQLGLLGKVPGSKRPGPARSGAGCVGVRIWRRTRCVGLFRGWHPESINGVVDTP